MRTFSRACLVAAALCWAYTAFAQEHGRLAAHDPPPSEQTQDAHRPATTDAPAETHEPTATHQPAAAHDKPNIFGGGIGNALITLVIFGSVVYILGTKAWPPVLRLLDERERSIRDSLESARKERTDAEALLEQYTAQIQHAREEATAIVDEGRRDAQEVRRRIQEEARDEAQGLVERARREIRLATDAAVKELYDRTADLAVQVASGIVKKELNASDHKHLVTESLERMSAEQPKLN